jgi:hypothetical protein
MMVRADVTFRRSLIFKQDADPMGRNHEGPAHSDRDGFSAQLPIAVLNTISGFHPRIPSRPLLDTFKDGALALGEKAFLPHMYIYDGLRAGCQFFGENR